MVHGTVGIKRALALLLTICFVLLLFAGCGKKRDAFAENDEILFRLVLGRNQPDQIVIQSLDAYRVENNYYYHAKFSYVSSLKNDWVDVDMVYFGYRHIDKSFSLNWTSWGDMEDDHQAYLEAVEKGEHRTFSQEKIKEYVDAYYSSRNQ